jgi:hypothetical protein
MPLGVPRAVENEVLAISRYARKPLHKDIMQIEPLPLKLF